MMNLTALAFLLLVVGLYFVNFSDSFPFHFPFWSLSTTTLKAPTSMTINS